MQGGGCTNAPALTYVVTRGGVVVHVVVSVAGGFVVKCCLVPAQSCYLLSILASSSPWFWCSWSSRNSKHSRES